MTHEFKTKDHPEANGRKPLVGEQQYVLTFPLDNGDTVKVACGKFAFQNFRKMIEQMDIDDLAERPI